LPKAVPPGTAFFLSLYLLIYYVNTFQSLGLRNDLLEAVQSLGFTEPTPIQQKAIPVLLEGTRDFVGLAQTGTGKTAAFGLPLLQLIRPPDHLPHPGALPANNRRSGQIQRS
jgi:superfamily II DNA/RNA helicase